MAIFFCSFCQFEDQCITDRDYKGRNFNFLTTLQKLSYYTEYLTNYWTDLPEIIESW